MSHNLKGVESGLLVLAYSPGLSKKKKPRVNIAAVAGPSGCTSRWFSVQTVRNRGNGMGLTRDGGGSARL